MGVAGPRTPDETLRDTDPPGDGEAPPENLAAIPELLPDVELTEPEVDGPLVDVTAAGHRRGPRRVREIPARAAELWSKAALHMTAKPMAPGFVVAERYRVVRFIASGGMADVYEVEDTVLAGAVALKVMQTDLINDEGARARFHHEAMLARKVTHTGVCRVFDVGSLDFGGGEQLPFMTMELLTGDTLSERIRKLGKLPAPMATRIAEQVAAALDAAHAAGIIHRDLKSGNILLVDQPDGAARAVVMDFGIAAAEQDPTALDRTGETLGTFGYMSPEQSRAEPATRASDIYAFGVVLHEMRTGRLPNRPGQPTTVAGRRTTFDRVTNGAPPRLEPGWELAIQRCLEEDPASRWPSASAAISCLRGEQRAPYRGLFPFEGDDRALFFGRSVEIQEVVERLRDQAVVVVAGDPGVGKSSLCRAGVVPQILDGALGGSIAWRVATVIPGRSPVTAVRDVVRMLRRYEAIGDGLPDPWVDQSVTSELLRAASRESGFLLFIDQLEELATMSEPEEATHLAQTIGRVAAAPVPGLRILATVRGDLLSEVAALGGIREMLSRSLYVLPHLGHSQLREAITHPANLHGVRFDPPEMVDELIDRAGRPVKLPLLQFTLSELWQNRDVVSGRITRKALEAIGGVEGALARHADGVIARLLPAQRPLARHILCELVTASRRVARRTENQLRDSIAEDSLTPADAGSSWKLSSLALCDESIEHREVLEQLIRGRLVVVDEIEGKAAYELAHESLVHDWPALRDWLSVRGARPPAAPPTPATEGIPGRPDEVPGAPVSASPSLIPVAIVCALAAVVIVAALLFALRG